MTCTIGRVGVSTANGGDGLSLQDPFEWQVSGRQVSIRGIHRASSDAAATWFAGQIQGLDPSLSLDELSVPFTSTQVPTLDGYYSVTSAQATIGRGALGTGTLDVEWQVSMVRALDSTRPRIEIPHAYAFLTNSLSFTNADLSLGYPKDGTLLRQSFLPTSRPTVTTEHGTIYWPYLFANGVSQSGVSGYHTASYIVDPDTHYAGGVRIYGASGDAVGRRDLTLATGAAGTGLTVSNGRVRVVVASTTTLRVQYYDGTSWGAGQTVQFQETTPAYGHTFGGATILKNAPDECVLRLVTFYDAVFGSVPAPRSGTVDVSVRRGDIIARCGASSIYSEGWKCYASGVAGTSITGGIRSTSTIDGEYLTIASNNGSTRDTSNCGLSSTGTGKTIFGLGMAPQLGSATGNWTGTDNLAAQFFFTHATTQRVVVG